MHAFVRLARCVLLAAPLACCSCSGTQSVTARHDNGQPASVGGHVRQLRSGPWTEYYRNGNKQSEGEYENDVQSGPWTYWFENGQKEMEGRFVDERREGPWTSWHDNGALRARGRFEGGFEEGAWRFHDASGALEREGTFELGQPVLRWSYYRPDGSVRETGAYLAGVKVGPWTARDANGHETVALYPLPAGCEWVEERFSDSSCKRAGFLRDGVPAGRWITCHPGGKLRIECSFRNGAPNGSARVWREDGSLLASGELKDGCVQGKWMFLRNGVQEQQESRDLRPRQTFSGQWSVASSAELPGWTAVETWIAELCSPRQPAPIPSVIAARASLPAASPAREDLSGIPARAQPWTEYERRVLPQLLKLYGFERAATDDYEAPVALRSSRSTRTMFVAKPADLVGRALPRKRFETAEGGTLDLDDFLGKRNVLVTILRGFGGQVCIYCTAQTRALAESADRFAALDTQVVVIFPGPASGLKAFLEAYRRTFGPEEKLPYTLLYDTDLSLTRALHIEDNIAVPTSILLDRKGIVRWCRVAKDHSDRPSTREILEQISALAKHER